MRPPTRLALILALLAIPACGPEQDHGDRAGVEVELGRAPQAKVDEQPAPAQPDPPPSTKAPVAAEPESAPEPQPELDDRQLALANVGRTAFDSLKAGKFTDFIALTPFVPGFLRDACPHMALGNRQELEARFNHCHKTIPWPKVAEAQAFAGKPTGAPASGCEAGIEEYGRLQLFLHLDDATIWRVDFFGAVGQDGNAIGINGEVSCRTVDKAPKL